MSITTYAELKTAVANWIDHSNLTDRVPEFITLCEARMNRELRVRRMLQRSHLTTSNEFVGVPSTWLGLRGISYTIGGARHSLKYETPEWMDRKHDNEAGPPIAYTILGSELQFWPSPDSSYRFDISYFKTIPALSDANADNWVLDNHPDLYLFGSTAEAHRYLKNMEEYQADLARFYETLKQVHQADKRDKYSGSALQIRVA